MTGNKQDILRLLKRRYDGIWRCENNKKNELEREKSKLLNKITDSIPERVEVKTPYGKFKVKLERSEYSYGDNTDTLSRQISRCTKIGQYEKDIKAQEQKFEELKSEIRREFENISAKVSLFGCDENIRKDVERFLKLVDKLEGS